MYGLLAQGIAVLSVVALAFGSGWHYGGKGPKQALKTLQNEVAANNLLAEAQRVERAAQDAKTAEVLTTVRKRLEEERNAASTWQSKVEQRLARVLVDVQAVRGMCTLPGSARRVWDDAAAPAADPPAVRPADSGEADRAAAPTECVDVYETGVKNTLAARFNADEVNRCWQYAIPLWEGCTGNTFPTAAKAPWLIKQPQTGD